MFRPLPVSQITIHRPAIPMRQKFAHATAERAISNPVIVAVELADHTIGFGETHPREYVTGESEAAVVETIRELFVPLIVELRPSSFGEAIEAIADLPMLDTNGRVITAARAAVELALLDAYSRAFERSLGHLAGWFEETALGLPGSTATARFGGVLSAMDPERIPRSLFKMRLGRLPHFKLKVGDADDQERLRATIHALRRGLNRGKLSLRLDANGAWSLEEAAERLQEWEEHPITCVEQPLAKGDPVNLAILAQNTNLPLMADESLVTLEDGEALIGHGAASWFNIRISKNGGLIPAMRLAILARHHHLECVLGCMVGETSILSAAARWFLQMVPGILYAEGNFGRFLLKDDVTRHTLRFGFGGRWTPLAGPGLGITVDEDKLEQLAAHSPIRLPL